MMRDWTKQAPNTEERTAATTLLREIIDADELTDAEREAFSDMLSAILAGERRCLSAKQRAWANMVHERIKPSYENLVSSGLVKDETKVPTLELLKRENLPMKPPRRPQG